MANLTSPNPSYNVRLIEDFQVTTFNDKTCNLKRGDVGNVIDEDIPEGIKLIYTSKELMKILWCQHIWWKNIMAL
jgi:hypothetical protein